MRRFLALARTAALESLAEPLSAVLFLVSAVVIHLAPAFHYHQFGEAGRLARECGFSSLLVFGLFFAVPAAVRTIGRELESGTAAVALALSVPRALFFCAKAAGVFVAFLVFGVASVFAASLSVFSSVAGSFICTESASHVWGPGLAAGLGFTLVAFAFAAAANRFLRTRFCVCACLFVSIAQPLALGASAFSAAPEGVPARMEVFLSLMPAFIALAAGCAVFIALASACAVRLKPAVVATLVSASVFASFVAPAVNRMSSVAGDVVHTLVPDVSSYWVVDRLANGGTIPWGDVPLSIASSLCLVMVWLVVGSALLERREIS